MIPTLPSKIDPSQIHSILLIRLRRIGDVVMTTPAVGLLRNNFPNAHISYVIEEPYRSLMEGHPLLDEVIVIPRKPGWREFLRRIRPIRKKRYDVLIDFHGGPRALWITLLSRARLKIGYRIKHKHRFYHIAIPRRPKQGAVHSVENHVNLIRCLGIEADSIPSLQPAPAQPEERGRISHLLRESGLENTPFAVLHIGAGNRFRDWGSGNLTGLLSRFARDTEFKVILVGGDEDRERAERLTQTAPEKIISLTGRLNFRELRFVIEQARLFIGPDSGPMHIAASTSTPIIAYFGPTLPANFAPWKAQSRVLETDLDCRPCRQIDCLYQDIRCLKNISPEDVFLACREMPASEPKTSRTA